MLKNFRQSVGSNWIGALGCFVLVGLGFILGYWQGQHSAASNTKSLTAKVAKSPFQREEVPHAVALPMTAAIPADATPELKEFLQNRTTLANNLAEIRSQNPKDAQGPEKIAQLQAQNEELLKRQNELSQTIAQQQVHNPLAEPPPLKLPPNVTPKMQLFLTTRNKLMREQIDLMNQYRTADPKTREAAMQQWQQQNANLIQQLREDAQVLSKPNKTKT